MLITLNGKEKKLTFPLSLKDLIEDCDLNAQRVAAEVNGQIIERKRYAKTPINAKDKIELIQFLGGG